MVDSNLISRHNTFTLFLLYSIKMNVMMKGHKLMTVHEGYVYSFIHFIMDLLC